MHWLPEGRQHSRAANNHTAPSNPTELCTQPIVVMVLCLQLAEAQKLLQHQQAQLKSLHSQVGRRAEQQLKAETAASAARQDLQVCSHRCGQTLRLQHLWWMEALQGSCRIAAAQTCSMWVHPATSQHTACAVAAAGLCSAPTEPGPAGLHCYSKNVC